MEFSKSHNSKIHRRRQRRQQQPQSMCCRWQYWEFEPRDVRSLRPGSKTEPPAEGWWSYSQLGCQESDTLNRSSSLDGDSGGAACGGCGVWWCPCGYVPIPSPFFNVDCGRNPHGQLTYYMCSPLLPPFVCLFLVMLLLKRSQGRCRRFNDLDISLYVTQHAILSLVKERHPSSFSLYTTSGGYKVMLMCRDFLDVKGGGIFGVVGGWKGEANYVKRRECCAELEIGVAPLRGDV